MWFSLENYEWLLCLKVYYKVSGLLFKSMKPFVMLKGQDQSLETKEEHA